MSAHRDLQKHQEVVISRTGLFVPGWGAPAGFYRRGMPAGWEVLELPSFRSSGGELDNYRCYLRDELESRPFRTTLAGHSLGAALALLAADERPDRVEALVLLAPAGLPYSRPLSASAITFLSQVARRRYPLRELSPALLNAALAPRAGLRLAREAHDLDLTPVLERIRARGIPCTVVACTRDRLAPPAHCRLLATRLDADYRELDSRNGHIWMISEPERLKATLDASSRGRY